MQKETLITLGISFVYFCASLSGAENAPPIITTGGT